MPTRIRVPEEMKFALEGAHGLQREAVIWAVERIIPEIGMKEYTWEMMGLKGPFPEKTAINVDLEKDGLGDKLQTEVDRLKRSGLRSVSKVSLIRIGLKLFLEEVRQ